VLFKITAHDGNISEITVHEMGQLAKNYICLTIPLQKTNRFLYICP